MAGSVMKETKVIETKRSDAERAAPAGTGTPGARRRTSRTTSSASWRTRSGQ